MNTRNAAVMPNGTVPIKRTQKKSDAERISVGPITFPFTINSLENQNIGTTASPDRQPIIRDLTPVMYFWVRQTTSHDMVDDIENATLVVRINNLNFGEGFEKNQHTAVTPIAVKIATNARILVS